MSSQHVIARIKQAAADKVAADPRLVRSLISGGAGALLGGGALAALSRSREDAAVDQARNTAFGAGMAAGLAGPRIVDVLHAALHPQPAPEQPT